MASLGCAESDASLLEHQDIVITATNSADSSHRGLSLESLAAEALHAAWSVSTDSSRMELCQVVNEHGTLLHVSIMDDAEVLWSDVMLHIGLVAIADSLKSVSADDCTANFLVLLLKDANLKSQLN